MQRHPQDGVTLIELMVTICIAAIIISLAVPSFTALINSNRLATQANDILGALMIARSEAIRLNRRVVLCRSDDGATCSPATGGWKGWLVFVDQNGNDTPDASEILRTGSIAADLVIVQGSIAISGQSNRVRIGSDGLARSLAGASASLLQARLSVCMVTSSPATNTREIRISSGGRALIVTVNNAGACPVPSNS